MARATKLFIFLLSVLWLTNAMAAEFSFNLLIYNVQMRPVLDNNSYKGSRISPLLNSYDIVGVQESFSDKEILLSKCDHLCKAHFTAKYCCFSFVDSGLSTLSKFPIIEQKYMHYRSRSGFVDIIASKGILLTRLEINNNIVDVYNTHMQAGESDDGLARLDQAAQLVEFVNNNSLATHSVMIIGDFNMGPLSEEEKEDFMIRRAATFAMMKNNLGLSDLETSLGMSSVNLDRILFRAGCGQKLEARAFHNLENSFTDEDGQALSDGRPIMGRFIIAKTNEVCEQKLLINPEPAPHTARFFQHHNHKGAWFSLKIGESRNLQTDLIFDRQVSSLVLGKDTVAFLSVHPDGNGPGFCIKNSKKRLEKNPRFIKVYSKYDKSLEHICPNRPRKVS